MDLRIDNLTTVEKYLAFWKEAGVRLPIREDPENFGVIMDADGQDVATVDVNCERDHDDVVCIIAAIVLAVNTCGGFRAERRTL